MRKEFKRSVSITGIASYILILGLAACGPRVNGNYTTTQTGSMTSYNAACSQINLAINTNGGQVSGSGTNSCFTETLTGTENNGSMSVTLMLVPSQNSGMSMYGGSTCQYTGTLMVSGNAVSGTLMSVGNYSCGGSLSIQGNKIN